MSFDLLKTLPQYFLPKKGLTTLAGCMANVTRPAVKNFLIEQFINKYQVNMTEALIEDPSAYKSFNDFFIRKLKAECRPQADANLISPVDGLVSELGTIEQGQLLQAKGRYYSVQELLDCSQSQAQQFINGQFATLYLSPRDYHRVHMPLNAKLLTMNYVPGALFSVQPSTAKVVPRLFARNERLVIYFETAIGLMAMVMVGATIVGAINTRWHGDIKRSKLPMRFDYSQADFKRKLTQGEEMGLFKLGSTVILLFAEGQNMQWHNALQAGSPIKFGERLGAFTKSN